MHHAAPERNSHWLARVELHPDGRDGMTYGRTSQPGAVSSEREGKDAVHVASQQQTALGPATTAVVISQAGRGPIERWLVIATALACWSTAALDLSGNTLFLATFDHGPAADMAAGRGEPLRPGTLTAVPGVSGNGIRVTERVEYDTEGNLHADAGTLSFYARPTALWTGTDARTVPLLGCVGGRAARKLLNALQIYLAYPRASPRWVLRFLLADQNEGPEHLSIVTDPLAAAAWQRDPAAWAHIVVCWSVGDMVLAVDGRVCRRSPRAARAPVRLPARLGRVFSLEPGFCFDQLLILDRALSEPEIAKLHRLKGASNMGQRPPPSPLFPVPRRTTPPVVDGLVGPAEWKQACAVTGFLGLTSKEYSHRQGTFWVAYDPATLYFAYRSSFPPGTQEGGAWDEKALRAFARERDGKVFADDSVELYLAPQEPTRYVQFIANCLGTINDRRFGEVSWDGDWQVCCRVDDDAGLWELEGAITFAELGVPAPRSGDTWFFNVARNWKGQEDLFTSLTGEYRKSMARLLFTDGSLAVHEQSWGKPLAGLPAADLALQSHTTEGIRVRTEWAVLDADGEPVAETEGRRDIRLDPGGEARLRQEHRVTEEGRYALRLALHDVGADASLYERELPFSVSQPVDLRPFYVLKTATLGVLTDLTRLPLNPLTSCSRIEYAVATRTGTVASATVDTLEEARFAVEFDTGSAVTPGTEVTMSCRFLATTGAVFQSQVDYRVPVEPDWYGAYDPPDGFVPYPWTPVRVDADAGTVACWNRTYTFGNAPLPVSIRVGRRELLRGPMLLQARVEGRDLTWDDGATEAVRIGPAAVTFRKQGRGVNLDVAVETTVEFDGYADCRITLTPRRPVTVSELQVTVPLRGEWIRFFHVDGQWGDRLFGPLVRRGEFTTLEEAHHYCWLGDDDTGFCWLAEDVDDWQPGAGQSALGFEKRGRDWVATFSPVGEPRTIHTPRQVRIGFQATPTRPPHARRVRGLLCYNTPPEKLNIPSSGIGDTVVEMTLKGKMNYPPFPQQAGTMRAWIAGHKAKGRKFLSYQYIDAGTETDAYAAYWGDWVAAMPPETMQWRTQTAKCCIATSWSDYCCWVLDTMMREFDTDGVYLDGVMARECRRRSGHGHGGMAAWPMSAARTHIKKLLYVARRNKGPEAILFGHVSLSTIAPLAGLLDLHLKGENYGAPLDYSALTPEVMRAEFGRQWGPQSIILPQLTKKQAIPASRFLGLIALHDVDCAPSWLPPESRRELLLPMWQAQEEFRIDTATFRPYWRQQLFREAGGAPVSLYARADERQYLLVVANQNDTPARLEIATGSAAAPGLSVMRVTDVFRSRDIPHRENRFGLDAEPWEFRLLRVTVHR